MLTLIRPAAASGRGAAIETPAAEMPARLAPGDGLDVVARLRLPLTPPPGVQQPRIWSGWSVGLRRTAELAADGADPVLEYRLRPLRVRPAGGDRYRLSAIVPPWVPTGTYALLLRGPGIEDEVPAAVIVDAASPEGVIDVVLPPGTSGLEAALDGRPLPARAVAFARFDGETGAGSGRVVRFALPPFAATDQGAAVRDVAARVGLRRLDERPCGARVRLLPDTAWPGSGCLGAAVYEGDAEAVTVLWEIGNRSTAAGPRARLSCVADTGVLVRATGFDGFGRPCRAGQRVPDRDPGSAAGCGCLAGTGRSAGLLGAILPIFFLSRPAAREYDAGPSLLVHGGFLMKGDLR